MEDKIYKIEELIELLGVSERAIQRLCQSGKLKSYRPIKRTYFLHSDVIAFIKGHACEGEEAEEQTQPTKAKSKARTSSKPRRKKTLPEGSMTPEDVLALYEELCPNLPQIQKLTDKRKQLIIEALLQWGDDKEAQQKTATQVFREASEACMFYREKHWFALEWLLKGDNWVKALEGHLRADSGGRSQTPDLRWLPKGGKFDYSEGF